MAILILSVANRKPGNLPRKCTPDAADVVLGEFDRVQCSANADKSRCLESNRGDGPNKQKQVTRTAAIIAFDVTMSRVFQCTGT